MSSPGSAPWDQARVCTGTTALFIGRWSLCGEKAGSTRGSRHPHVLTTPAPVVSTHHRGSPMSCTLGGGSRRWWWALGPRSLLQSRGRWHRSRCTGEGAGNGWQGFQPEHRDHRWGRAQDPAEWAVAAAAENGSWWRGKLGLLSGGRRPLPRPLPGGVQRAPLGTGPQERTLGLHRGSVGSGSQQYCQQRVGESRWLRVPSWRPGKNAGIEESGPRAPSLRPPSPGQHQTCR